MRDASSAKLVSVADYLAGELSSDTKHEYLGGMFYALAGGRNVHNLIATNALAGLHAGLRGKPCRPYNSDTKIRIRSATQTRFYYPDASVICNPNPPDDSFQDQPVVVVEVLSPATRRTDEGEKKDTYLAIPSLVAYLLVEAESAAVAVHRRTDEGFVREVYEGLGATVALEEIDVRLALADLYDGVEFTPISAE